MTKIERSRNELEKIAARATQWIGSVQSLVVHTFLFIAAFVAVLLGVPLSTMLLALTTVVSLEAIYLAIFIQMSVNKNTKDIEYIQEDVEDIEEDIDEIQKDVDEIQEDVEEIEEDMDEDEKAELRRDKELMSKIELSLGTLMEEIQELKKNKQK